MPSKIRGTGVLVFTTWLRARLPPARVAAILARLAPSTAAALEGALPSSQVPYALYGELLEATFAELGRDYERQAFDHGRFAADDHLGGVYRSAVREGQVEKTVESMARGWALYFDTGKITVIERAPGRQVFEVHDASYHPLHPPISAGYTQRACELAGGKDVRVVVTGAPPRVLMTITWAA